MLQKLGYRAYMHLWPETEITVAFGRVKRMTTAETGCHRHADSILTAKLRSVTGYSSAVGGRLNGQA